MTSYAVISRTGNVRSGETDSLWIPSAPRPEGNYGVVLVHGAGAPNQYTDAPRYASLEIAARLAWAGIPCVAAEMSGNAFANDNAMTDIDNAITYLAANTTASADKVHLLGVSMGGGTALRFAALNPNKVASVIGLIPMCNINRLYQENILGLRAQIGTAWGVTYPAALPAGADLLTLAAAIDANDIPVKLWYDDADTTILPADVVAMAAACGTTAISIEIDPEDYGHTEASLKMVVNAGAGEASEIVNFFLVNGA